MAKKKGGRSQYFEQELTDDEMEYRTLADKPIMIKAANPIDDFNRNTGKHVVPPNYRPGKPLREYYEEGRQWSRENYKKE